MAIEKFCTKCGKKFIATGREVICPECRESAKLEAKRAAVLKAKRASWTGESVPVRISGRASTVIREYAAASGLTFAAALDALLQSTNCFKGMNMSWEEITPYKSRRMKKSGEQDAPQDKPQEVKQDVTRAAKTSKTTASKAAKTSKAAGKAGKKA